MELFFLNFSHKYSIEFRYRMFTDHVIDFICFSEAKFYSPLRCDKIHYRSENDFIITKPIFYR